MTDPNERLKKARERKAQAEAAREKLAEAQASELEVKRAEVEAEDAEAVLAAEQEHGAQGDKIGVINTPLGCVIVKRPSEIRFKQFQDNDKTDSSTMDQLIYSCLVYPNPAQLGHLFSEYPAKRVAVANVAVYLAGARKEDLLGKYGP